MLCGGQISASGMWIIARIIRYSTTGCWLTGTPGSFWAAYPHRTCFFSMKFSYTVIIVSCSSPGDTIRRMGQIAGNINPGKAMRLKVGYEWDAHLPSGGGKDLIDDADEIVFNTAESFSGSGGLLRRSTTLADTCPDRRRIQKNRGAQEWFR